MFMYDKFFGEYNRTVAQVLLTGDVVSNPHSKQKCCQYIPGTDWDADHPGCQ